MEVDKDDETWVSELYRQYQQGRDNINQSALFKIRESANAMFGTAPLGEDAELADYQNKVMQDIRSQARQLYINTSIAHEGSTPDVSEATGLPKQRYHGWQRFREFIDSFNRPWYIGVAASLVLVSILTLKLTAPPTGLNGQLAEYKSLELIKHSAFVSEQVSMLAEWQHGFAMGDPSAREAFVAGLYMVDLINLDESIGDQKSSVLLDKLADIHSGSESANIRRSIENLQRVSKSDQLLSDLNTVLENHYQNQTQTEMYELGKWLEFNYLHTKLTLQSNNIELFTQNVNQGDAFISKLARKGLYPQLIQQYVSDLVVLYSAEPVSMGDLKRRLVALETLRVMLR